uniref:Uncharacterized protein n=1 Tax=Aegilops tauschii subsp. strangulata TaxID=200361 RepID=A0A453QVU2_AEGTS
LHQHQNFPNRCRPLSLRAQGLLVHPRGARLPQAGRRCHTGWVLLTTNQRRHASARRDPRPPCGSPGAMITLEEDTRHAPSRGYVFY